MFVSLFSVSIKLVPYIFMFKAVNTGISYIQQRQGMIFNNIFSVNASLLLEFLFLFFGILIGRDLWFGESSFGL